ncbi:DUF3622 domain-containing protein [Psychromonas sp. Urea-02u-13]|uniref:DUF3622 domain-containing protein n=1 Tax=Psychromonas sp. Urea-02u-13 TaxID=2058326 RepID=UPI000C3491B3|nr:DUF3622 domain-containing protein [Psychromonas sp. Urea-02u-13]PKG37594.1 DUF3622 domain-containing protein [Psychromonas sp. Urea-02u-13]
MAQEKKFDFSIKQDGEQWNAEITRRVSARKTSVSKQKKGFETEALATEWATAKLAECLENLQAGNKRKSEKRVVRNDLAAKAIADKETAAILYEEKQQAYFEALDEEDEERFEQDEE